MCVSPKDIKVDIITFSKASKYRNPQIFAEIFNQLNRQLVNKKISDKIPLFPLDSTTVTLTSKLLWKLDIYQVKLFAGQNLVTSEV